MGSEAARPRAKAVFFDRDGTLNRDVDYLHRVEDFEWMPEAKEAIRYAKEQGYLAIVVTNQSGVARGYYPEEDVRRVYDWMNGELAKIGTQLDGLYYCPHLPGAPIAAYDRNCDCRKPKTGLVDAAVRDHAIDRSASYLVGDSERDIVCAKAAGLTGIPYKGGSLLDCLKRALEESRA